MNVTLPGAFRSCRGQRGQVLYLAVLLIAVLGGSAALAVDLGGFLADRRDLQNAADAVALAASRELPDEGAARGAAEEWAVKNEIDPASMTLTFVAQNPPGEPNPKVRVELERDHRFVFARLIGITSASVTTTAGAIKTSPAGGDGVTPLSVTDEALAGADFGDEVVLKYDANDIVQGNTGPLRIDAPGSGNCTSTDNYCAAIKFGSQNVVCVAGADPASCDGASSVETEPGNKIGATKNGINYLLEHTDSHCDEFAEVFEDDPTTSEEGAYRVVQACNPFLPGGYDSKRVLIIPVIDELCSGSCTVTIVDFALFFLEGFENPGRCNGNDCEIMGRFVRVSQNVGLFAGTYDADSSNQFVRLVE